MGQAGEDAVNILLHAKGDAEQLDNDDISPIVLAVSKGITGAVASLEAHDANPFHHRRQDGQGLIAYALNRGEEYELRLALQLTSSEQLLSQVDSIREIFKHDPLHRWIHTVFVLGRRYSNPTHVERELQRFYDVVYNESTGEVSLSDTHNTTYVTGIMGAIMNAFQKLIQLPHNTLGQ